MHISNLGFNIPQRKIKQPGQVASNESKPEARGNLEQSNFRTKDVPVVASEEITICSKNFLARDIEIKGSITLTEELFVDGRVDGEINSTGALTVGEDAEILGHIKANSARIFGKIRGNITADDYCELKAQSVLEGDLKASCLVMEEGASFVGNSKIIPSRVVVKLPHAMNPIESGNADQSVND